MKKILNKVVSKSYYFDILNYCINYTTQYNAKNQDINILLL